MLREGLALSRAGAEERQAKASGVLVGVSPLPAAKVVVAAEMGDAPPMHVLVVDDDALMRRACGEIARSMGFAVASAESVAAAKAVLKQRKIDLLLLDLKLPDGGGLQLLEQVKAMYPDTAVVVMTAFATVSSAVEAMRIGAGDYLTKPFALEELTAVLGRAGQRLQFDGEARRLREKLRSGIGAGGLLGESPEMERLYRILSKVAFSTHPVLIVGESGTGKEVVARTIHANGPNAKKPFVPVDCGSLEAGALERALFGYEKGAFAGAERAKMGLLAEAEGGVVFLDEIGELALDLQAKLLRALQEKAVRPVGSQAPVPIAARVLAATNRDLMAMVESGRFRRDLYFRLNVVNLRIPPLRDRRGDIPMLAMHFLERADAESGQKHQYSDDALRVMTEYEWPGNVRELENAIERACALSSGPVLHMGDLPTQLQEFRLQRATESPVAARVEAGAGARDAGGARVGVVSIAEMEKHAILGTIQQLKGDKLLAARLLGIGKTTLYRKLKEYGITEGTEVTG